jgi:hypothetical protein
MKTQAFLGCLAIFLCQATFSIAQTAGPITYTVYGYHKVMPGHSDDFTKLAKVWKKIVAAKKKAGLQDDWSFAQIVVPAGAPNGYTHVTRHTFIGAAQLANYLEKPFLHEGWQTGLTTEEIAIALNAHEIRTFVRNEVWSEVDKVLAADNIKATVAVFNFFKQPEGKTLEDHIKLENELWKPIHAARIKDGIMKGWLVLALDLPYGSGIPYDMATIDVYSDMKQMLLPWFREYFKRLQPNMTIEEVNKRSSTDTDLIRSEVRLILDRLDW